MLALSPNPHLNELICQLWREVVPAETQGVVGTVDVVVAHAQVGADVGVVGREGNDVGVETGDGGGGEWVHGEVPFPS